MEAVVDNDPVNMRRLLRGLAIGTSSRFIFTSRLRVAQRNALGMPMNDSSPTGQDIRPIGRDLTGEKTPF